MEISVVSFCLCFSAIVFEQRVAGRGKEQRSMYCVGRNTGGRRVYGVERERETGLGQKATEEVR